MANPNVVKVEMIPEEGHRSWGVRVHLDAKHPKTGKPSYLSAKGLDWEAAQAKAEEVAGKYGVDVDWDQWNDYVASLEETPAEEEPAAEETPAEEEPAAEETPEETPPPRRGRKPRSAPEPAEEPAEEPAAEEETAKVEAPAKPGAPETPHHRALRLVRELLPLLERLTALDDAGRATIWCGTREQMIGLAVHRKLPCHLVDDDGTERCIKATGKPVTTTKPKLAPEEETAPPKRGRGRPPKVVEEPVVEEEVVEETPKRPVGRPQTPVAALPPSVKKAQADFEEAWDAADESEKDKDVRGYAVAYSKALGGLPIAQSAGLWKALSEKTPQAWRAKMSEALMTAREARK